MEATKPRRIFPSSWSGWPKRERITVTRHGVPVAMLVPTPTAGTPDVRAAVEEMKRFRKGRSLGALTIREMIEEGRRF